MRERLYKRSSPSDPKAHGYDLYLFGANRDGVRYIRPQEWVWLAEAQPPFTRDAGSVYMCPLDNVHTVAPIGAGFVATVVVQGPPIVDPVPVYAPIRQCPRAYENPISAVELSADLIALEQVLVRAIASKALSPAPEHVPWSFPDAVFEDNSGAFQQHRRVEGAGRTVS
jgi:hypothetical protein